MIDSHALVGSCAQVGKRVHVSAGAQIGGVLEPVGALPGHRRGRRPASAATRASTRAPSSRRGRSSGPAPILTGSTPVYDLPNGRILRPEAGAPLVIPEGAVVVPGARAVTVGAGRELGPVARDARDRQVPRREDRRAHGARSVAALSVVELDAGPRRHRLDDRARGRARARGWPNYLRAARLRRHASSRSTAGAPTSSPSLDPRPARRPLDPRRLRAAVLPQPTIEGGRLYGRGACDAKGALAAQVTAAERLRDDGERRASASCSWSARSAAATGPPPPTRSRPGPAFLVNGEPTEGQPRPRARAACLPGEAAGRAAAPRTRRSRSAAISAIDKLLDALVALRAIELPEDPRARAGRSTRSASSRAASPRT